MICTNNNETFGRLLEDELADASSVDICVGYCGASAIRAFAPKLVDIAERGGRVRLILGMYAQSRGRLHMLFAELCRLHKELAAAGASGSGVFICIERDYHGKIYCIEKNAEKIVWLGSNNFSDQGLRARLEACTRITSPEDLLNIQNYIDMLAQSNRCVCACDYVLPEKEPSRLSSLEILHELPAELSIVSEMSIKLRPSVQPQSCLNLCFGIGRRDKDGKYHPRNWLEVEISAPTHEIDNPCYPKDASGTFGKNRRFPFCAYLTHDEKTFYKTVLASYSDRNKAIGSSPRTLLGEFIKGALLEAGAMREGDPVTDDVLEEYGRKSITLRKLSDRSYVLVF